MPGFKGATKKLYRQQNILNKRLHDNKHTRAHTSGRPQSLLLTHYTYCTSFPRGYRKFSKKRWIGVAAIHDAQQMYAMFSRKGVAVVTYTPVALQISLAHA